MPHTPIQIYIPDAAHIDYTNVDEVCGYQLLISKIFELAGGFDIPLKTNNAIREVQKQGRIWLKNTKTVIDKIFDPSNLNGLTLAAIPHLLSAYDLLYRICNGTPIFDYIRKIRLKTADSWAKGNKTISSTAIALMIADELNHDIRGLDDRYSTYYLRTENQWVNELMKHGKFIGIQLCEVYDRLRTLLKVDLFAYLGSREQAQIKSRWVATHILDDPSTLDLQTHWAYISFLRTATQKGYYNADDPQAQYIHLFSTLATRPTLHHFYKEAIRIDLEKYAVYVRV